MDENQTTSQDTRRTAYDVLFNRDGSYKTTEQYLAETGGQS